MTGSHGWVAGPEVNWGPAAAAEEVGTGVEAKGMDWRTRGGGLAQDGRRGWWGGVERRR